MMRGRGGLPGRRTLGPGDGGREMTGATRKAAGGPTGPAPIPAPASPRRRSSRGARRAGPRYLALVRRCPLLPIRSEAELDRAIARLDALSDRGRLAPDEREYLLVLAALVERYEDEHDPMGR